MRSDQAAGAPLRELVGGLEIAHSTPSRRGRHQFFAVMAFKARTSSVRSVITRSHDPLHNGTGEGGEAFAIAVSA